MFTRFIFALLLMLPAQTSRVDFSHQSKETMPPRSEAYYFEGDFSVQNGNEYVDGRLIQSHRVRIASVDLSRQLYIYAPPSSGSPCTVARYMVTPTHIYVCSVDIHNQLPSGPVVGKWARIALETSW